RVEAGDRPRAVEEDERLPLARAEDGGVGAVDRVPALRERRHQRAPTSSSASLPAFARMRGITSSANRFMFFTVFHSGMSPSSSTTLMRATPASSAQPAIVSATVSGGPSARRL